jgi:hypothetical protein
MRRVDGARQRRSLLENLSYSVTGKVHPIPGRSTGFKHCSAHIKKRSLCTDDERRDLRHVAMLAYSFGCDALYEAGWITVDGTGQIRTMVVPECQTRYAKVVRQIVT